MITLRRRALIRCFALALAVGFCAAPAAAQTAADVAAARDLFIEGSELARQGSWEAARACYERSLVLKRAAITYYSLGVAQQQTGQLVEALESFRAFLVEPQAPATKVYEEPARKAIVDLEPRVAHLEINLSPADVSGLEVKVDGALVPAAALEMPRLVNPGRHEVTACAPGYREVRQSVAAEAGGRATVKLSLDREATAPPRSAPPATTAVPPPGRSDAEPAAPAPSRAVPIALLAGGVVTLAAGVTVGLLGVSKAFDAPTRDGDDADGARTQALAGDLVAGAGLVTTGVGLVMLLLQRFPSGASREQRPAGVLIGPGVAALRLRF